MKVFITGGTGQLGHALINTAPTGYSLILPTRDEFDLARPETLSAYLDKAQPDAVINPAAYTAVDKAEEERELAFTINQKAVQEMARYCRAAGIPLIQVSTDFVFAGDSDTPYQPDAQTAPAGVYGQSKLAGEQAALAEYPDAYIVRASWIYSEHGNNFVKTMLRLGADRDALTVVQDQAGTPTYARNLAKALWQLLETQPEQRLLHYSDAGQTTWYDFAQAIFEEAVGAGMLDKAPSVAPTTAAEYAAPAPRPAFSVLDCQDSCEAIGLSQVEWRAALRDMLAALKSG